MAANLAVLTPEPSKASSTSCLLASGVRTRPGLSCLRISPADTIDAVDVIASRLRHLHYLRQGVLRATLTVLRATLTERELELQITTKKLRQRDVAGAFVEGCLLS